MMIHTNMNIKIFVMKNVLMEHILWKMVLYVMMKIMKVITWI